MPFCPVADGRTQTQCPSVKAKGLGHPTACNSSLQPPWPLAGRRNTVQLVEMRIHISFWQVHRFFPLQGSLKTAATDCQSYLYLIPDLVPFGERLRNFRMRQRYRIYFMKDPYNRKSAIQILIRYIIFILRRKSSPYIGAKEGERKFGIQFRIYFLN